MSKKEENKSCCSCDCTSLAEVLRSVADKIEKCSTKEK